MEEPECWLRGGSSLHLPILNKDEIELEVLFPGQASRLVPWTLGSRHRSIGYKLVNFLPGARIISPFRGFLLRASKYAAASAIRPC